MIVVQITQILGNCVAHPCNEHQAVFLIGVDSRLGNHLLVAQLLVLVHVQYIHTVHVHTYKTSS